MVQLVSRGTYHHIWVRFGEQNSYNVNMIMYESDYEGGGGLIEGQGYCDSDNIMRRGKEGVHHGPTLNNLSAFVFKDVCFR